MSVFLEPGQFLVFPVGVMDDFHRDLLGLVVGWYSGMVMDEQEEEGFS